MAGELAPGCKLSEPIGRQATIARRNLSRLGPAARLLEFRDADDAISIAISIFRVIEEPRIWVFDRTAAAHFRLDHAHADVADQRHFAPKVGAKVRPGITAERLFVDVGNFANGPRSARDQIAAGRN